MFGHYGGALARAAWRCVVAKRPDHRHGAGGAAEVLLGLLFTSMIMIALPLVYVGLIGVVCCAVYWHMMHDAGIIALAHGGRAAVFMLLVYLSPLVIGSILIVFMIKPLFAPPAREGWRRSLTRQGEPVLFALVDKVCAVVNAPAPKRIDINCDVNASAGMRRGWLSALAGSDLVLTLGMPLAAGLSLEQFAGVLAHEFGHFSQGAGMRLTYVVRSINLWFLRVVYQRDSWDVWLANSTNGLDVRVAWILYLAQLCVWLTRKVLWVLMLLGNLVAGFMLRQMEFDADGYEARLVGSETFEATARKLLLLNVAYRGAQADTGAFYREGRLPDDIPSITPREKYR
jgi:Zn-dependent protease with chaperone function